MAVRLDHSRGYRYIRIDAPDIPEDDAPIYRQSRPSASGLDPEGEGRRKINQTTSRTVCTVRNPQRRVKDLNPTLTATVWKCDSSQHPRLRRGATGVVGRGGAADPHGRTERSGVNSNRPISGRSRGIKFACDGTPQFGTCGQNGEAAGLVPAVLHVSEHRLVAFAYGLLSGVRAAGDPREVHHIDRERSFNGEINLRTLGPAAHGTVSRSSQTSQTEPQTVGVDYDLCGSCDESRPLHVRPDDSRRCVMCRTVVDVEDVDGRDDS